MALAPRPLTHWTAPSGLGLEESVYLDKTLAVIAQRVWVVAVTLAIFRSDLGKGPGGCPINDTVALVGFITHVSVEQIFCGEFQIVPFADQPIGVE